MSETTVDTERTIRKEDIRAFRRTREPPQLDEQVVSSVWRVQMRDPRRLYAQEAINKIVRLAPHLDDSEKARSDVTDAFSHCISVLETHSTELKRTRTVEDDENDAKNAAHGCNRSSKARYHHPLKMK